MSRTRSLRAFETSIRWIEKHMKHLQPLVFYPSRERVHIPPMEKEHHLPSYLWKGYVGSRRVNYQTALNETVETSRPGATRLFALGRLPWAGWNLVEWQPSREKNTTTFCFKEMSQVGSSFRSWSEVNDLNFVLRIKFFDFKWLSSKCEYS